MLNIFEGWKKKLSAAVDEEEDDEITFKNFEEEKVAPEAAPEEAEAPKEQIKQSSIGGGNLELKVLRPESMNEIFAIADFLIGNYTVVLNLELLNGETIQRMLDFLNGVIYTKGGDMECVANGTYIITPTGINIDK